MNNRTLNIGSKYWVKYPRSSLVIICKLIAKHEATMPHEKLYTFTDENGIKLIFTNGVFKNMFITEYIEPIPAIKRIESPYLSMPLPYQNKNFLGDTIPLISTKIHVENDFIVNIRP